MEIKSLHKIIIIGDAGRGKTTLASLISIKLNIPYHSTDDYFYEIKYSKRRDRQESIDQISKNFLKDKWIVEGTTRHLLEPGLESADIIIYLKYRNIFSQWFTIITRHFKRKDESILKTIALMKHVFYKRYDLGYKKGTTTHSQLIEPYKNKVVTLASFREIDDFITSI